jgi:hypothetical protein
MTRRPSIPPEAVARLAQVVAVAVALVVGGLAAVDAWRLVGRTPIGAMSTGVVARDPILRGLEELQTYDFLQELRCCGVSAWRSYDAELEIPADSTVDLRVVRAGDRFVQSVAPETWTATHVALGFGPPFVAGWILLATALLLTPRAARDPGLVPVALLTCVLGFQQLTALDVNWVHRFERLQVATLTLIPAVLLHLSLVFPKPTKLFEEIPGVVSPIYTLAAVALVLERSMSLGAWIQAKLRAR